MTTIPHPLANGFLDNINQILYTVPEAQRINLSLLRLLNESNEILTVRTGYIANGKLCKLSPGSENFTINPGYTILVVDNDSKFFIDQGVVIIGICNKPNKVSFTLDGEVLVPA